jgi:hypothetical protein
MNAVGAMYGWRGRETLTLSGAGGGTFDVNSKDIVTLTVSRGGRTGPPATQVADAIAGRAPTAAVRAGLSASARTALARMGDSSTRPEPAPARTAALRLVGPALQDDGRGISRRLR